MSLLPGKSGFLLTPGGGGGGGRPSFEPVLGAPLRHQEIESILAFDAMLLKQPYRVLGEVELLNQGITSIDSLMPQMYLVNAFQDLYALQIHPRLHIIHCQIPRDPRS